MDALLPFAQNKWQRRINPFLRKLKIGRLGRQPYESHITAAELVDKMGRDAFDAYFSFAIVRNPWDWQVSMYHYMLKEPRHMHHELAKGLGSFEKFVEWYATPGARCQKDFVYSHDGQQLVDFIGRFERLEADFQLICARLGVSASLPKLNVSNTRPYREFYTERTRKLVQQALEPDISLFGYEF